MAAILICDDEKDIVNALEIYLTNPEYSFFEAYNGKQAVDIAISKDIDLVILDIMMPVMDGIEAMERIREYKNVPIILLTAKGEDVDKVMGLNRGADDYITKPFSPAEVTARVRSQLRRYTRLGGAEIKSECLRAGGIELDDRSKSVSLDGEPVTLTPTEYDILHLMMKNPGRVFSPREIYRLVWNDEPFGGENTVAVHIRHLREKLETDPAHPRWLKLVWGHGYKIEGGTK